MKVKKYPVLLIVILTLLLTACGSPTDDPGDAGAGNPVADKYPFFSEMEDVSSIKLQFRGETDVDLSFVDIFLNMDADEIKKGRNPFSDNGDTGRQAHVLRCFDVNNESLYHFQYYPDYDDHLDVMVIKRIDSDDDRNEPMYFTITNEDLIQFLRGYETKVDYD